MKNPTPTQNNIQKVQEKINSVVPPQQETKQPLNPQKKQILVSVLLVLLGISVTVLGFSIYSLLNSDANNFLTSGSSSKPASGGRETASNAVNNQGSGNTSQAESGETTEVSELFYLQDMTDIYSYDPAAKEVAQWNDGSSQVDVEGEPHTEIKSLERIDANTVGFSRCDVVAGNYNCALYTLDLDSNTVSRRKSFGADDLLTTVGWGGINKVGYITETDNRWRMTVQDKTTKTVLKTIESAMAGRGGSRNDISAIKFSPSTNKVLYIDTAPPDKAVDFTVYVYNLETNQELQVADATHPAWLNENEIVYRDVEDQVLKVFNLNTQAVRTLAGSKPDAYFPHVLINSGKILYETYPEKAVYAYDAEEGTNEKITDLAQGPVWLSSQLIAYEELEPCPESGCEEGYRGEPIHERSVVIFDLSSKTKMGYVPSLESTYTFTSHWQN